MNSRACKRCGEPTLHGANFCTHCGAQLRDFRTGFEAKNGASKQKSSAFNQNRKTDRSPIDPSLDWDQSRRPFERRQLTIMFCDLVNSTRLSESIDPEDLGALIESYRTAAIVPIKRYGGVVARYQGDGMMVYFGYPDALEDAPDRAARAALEIVAAVKKLNVRWRETAPNRIAVRIGIHTGVVVVGDVEKADICEPMAVFGETPNLAARLQTLAEPDTVVVSGETQSLLSRMIRCRPRGRTMIRGLTRPVMVFDVLRNEAGLDRKRIIKRQVPFVNRSKELMELKKSCMNLRKGNGCAALLSGDPGIGKSRLIEILKNQIVSKPFYWINSRASPYAVNSDFFAFSTLFRNLTKLPESKESSIYQHLQQYLSQQGLIEPNTVLGFAYLLGINIPDSEKPTHLTSEHLRKLTFSAIKKWFWHQAEQQPTVLTIEDLHWADASTLEVIKLIIDEIASHPLLLIMSSRDGTIFAESGHSIQRLHLDRLASDDAHRLLNHVIRYAKFSSTAIDTLLARASGVPLFIEELPRPILERRESARPSHYAEEQPVPATLRDSLMTQLDRMGSAKAVAQIGAALGHSFDAALLKQVWDGDSLSLEDGIEALTDASLLIQRGTSPDTSYDFKHALIADTAYETLLRQDRRKIHQRAAEALNIHFQDVVEAHPEMIARHLAAAGDRLAAFGYWLRAGRAAARRSANTEAIGHMRNAEAELVLLEKAGRIDLIDQRLSLLFARGPVQIALSGWSAPDVEETYREALSLAESSPAKNDENLTAWLGLYNVYSLRGDLTNAQAVVDRLHKIAIDTRHEDALPNWHRIAGYCDFLASRYEMAIEHMTNSIVLYKPDQQLRHTTKHATNPTVIACSIMAWSYLLIGNSTEATKASISAIEEARRSKHPFSLGYALCLAASLAQCRNRASEAYSWSNEALDLSIEHEFPYWRAWSSIIKGWSLAVQSSPEIGLPILKDGIAQYAATGASQMRGYSLCLLAEASLHANRWRDVVNTCREAIDEIEHTGINFYQPEAYRLLGEGMLHLDYSPSIAMRMLIRSFRMAERHHSYMLQLKTACTLIQRTTHQRIRDVVATRASHVLALIRQNCPQSDLLVMGQELNPAAPGIKE